MRRCDPGDGGKSLLTTTQDPKAALALVTGRPSNTDTVETEALARHEDSDRDLKRAKDLLELHTTVKVAHQGGTDKGLNDAREAVDRILMDLRYA